MSEYQESGHTNVIYRSRLRQELVRIVETWSGNSLLTKVLSTIANRAAKSAPADLPAISTFDASIPS